MAQFAGWLLNKYIAPWVSEFDSAEIPDMTSYHPESAHWVDNHFLNNSLRGALNTSAAAYIANYLRRAEGAFSEHALCALCAPGGVVSIVAKNMENPGCLACTRKEVGRSSRCL